MHDWRRRRRRRRRDGDGGGLPDLGVDGLVRLSQFSRDRVSRVSDEVEITVGGSIFEGNGPTTFGTFDQDDSVFARLRYGF